MTQYRHKVVLTLKGAKVGVWEPVVPRISDIFLDAVVFLYASEEAAEKQANAGGTGFILGVPWEKVDKRHYYFVTNKHVAKNGFPVVRLNTGRAHSDVVPLTSDQWQEHEKFDIAVCPFELPPEWSNVACISHDTIITQSQILNWGIGCGDDVFVVGRFIGLDRSFWNTPFVHTGVISRAPGIPMDNEATGQFEIGWTVELHSRGGYSGSPVFGYISPKQIQIGGRDRSKVGEIIYLLGILWAYHADNVSVRSADGAKLSSFVPVGNGLAGVVKADEITKLLMRPDEVARRKSVEEDFMKDNTNGSAIVPAAEDDGIEKTKSLLKDVLRVSKDDVEQVHKNHDQA